MPNTFDPNLWNLPIPNLAAQNTQGTNLSFADQGHAGVGGNYPVQPNPNPLGNPMSRGPMSGPPSPAGPNPMSRGPANLADLGKSTEWLGYNRYQVPDGVDPNAINYFPGSSQNNPTLGSVQSLPGGLNIRTMSGSTTPGTSAFQQAGNITARSSSPGMGLSGLGTDSGAVNPMARQGGGSTQDLSNITYNQQMGKKAAAGNMVYNTTEGTGSIWDQYKNNPFGTSGFNIMNQMAQLNAGGTMDPAWSKYINMRMQEDSKMYEGRGSDRLNPSGYVMIGGKPYVQVGDVNPAVSDRHYKSTDPANFTYDDEFGILSPLDNMDLSQDGLDRAMPFIVAAGLGIPTALAATGGMGAAGGAAAGTESGGSLASQYSGMFGPGAGDSAASSWLLEGGGPASATAGAGAASGTGTAAGTGAAAGGSSISGLINNPLVRGLGGSVLKGILGGQGGGNPTAGSSGGGFDLGSLLQGGFNLYNDNKGIQDIKNTMWDFYNRGDYNAQYRPGYLQRLSQLENDPSGVIANDQGYQNMRQQEVDNEARMLNARGFNMSGNEQGEIAKLMKNMDTKYINDAKSSLRQSASLGNPETMAAAGMRNLPMLAQMQANRNAAANGALNKIFGGKSVGDWLDGLMKGIFTKDQIPPEVFESIGSDESANLDMGNPFPAGSDYNFGPGAADSDGFDWWFGD